MWESRTWSLLAILSIMFGLMACGGSSGNGAGKDKAEALARVHDQLLYPSDLDGIGLGLPPADSAEQVRLYVEKWINDELLAHTAENQVPEQIKDRIDRLVHAYRSSLILDSYEQALINERLDSTVSPQELSDYYTKNKEQYQAGESWLRCHYVRALRTAPEVKNLRNWFSSTEGMDFEQVKMFCAENETVHILDEDKWIRYSKVLAGLPDGNLSDRYLSGDGIYNRTDEKYIYLLKVFEYRDKNDAAPLSQVSDEINRIILHQRRTQLLKDIRKEVYQKGLQEKKFEIF